MSPSVRREIVLPVQPEQAWPLVSRPDHLSRWLAPDVRIDARPGGELVVTWEDGAVRRGVVEEVEAPRRLAFRWADTEQRGQDDAGGESRVEIAVEPAPGGGSRIAVVETQTRRAPAQPVTALLDAELGWSILLRRLAAAGASAPGDIAVAARR